MPDVSGSWILFTSVALGFAAVLGCGYCVFQRRMRTLGQHIDARVATLEHDFGALCTAQSELGDRLMGLERGLQRITERQARQEMKMPVTEDYRHAISLAVHGASRDALIADCGLTPAEAELVRVLHHEPGAVSPRDANG